MYQYLLSLLSNTFICREENDCNIWKHSTLGDSQQSPST